MSTTYQKLSCKEGGAFDYKRQQTGVWRDTRWTEVCRDRQKRGISRSARIRARRTAA